MTEHLSRAEIERISRRAGKRRKPGAAVEHLAVCPACREVYRGLLTGRRGGVSITLDPVAAFFDEHLDYETKAAYSGRCIDRKEREIIEEHLAVCIPCREGLEDFMRARARNDAELRIRHLPHLLPREGNDLPPREGNGSWLTGWRTAAAALLILGAVALLSVLLLRGGDDSSRVAGKTEPLPAAPGKVGDDDAVTSMPKAKEEALVALNDGGRRIALDRSGRLLGLDELTEGERAMVKSALDGRFARPEILSELESRRGALRGVERRGIGDHLLAPRGEVVSGDRPLFRWRGIEGAKSYRIYIIDGAGRTLAESPRLAEDRLSWRADKPLDRGEDYSWILSAEVGEDEVVAPAPGEPEVRFRVIDEESYRRLQRQLRQSSSHLARSVFYARAGALSDAERELRRLLADNPGSLEARRFLRSIRSWR